MTKVCGLQLQRFNRQTCGVCHFPDKFNFHVPDDLWNQVVPAEYQNQTVCLQCFDELARERDVDYATALDLLYFAGDQATLTFRAISARNVYSQST